MNQSETKISGIQRIFLYRNAYGETAETRGSEREKMKAKTKSRFPPGRIKRIMQLDEEVGKVAAVVPVLVSRAVEIFMQSLLQGSIDETRRLWAEYQHSQAEDSALQPAHSVESVASQASSTVSSTRRSRNSNTAGTGEKKLVIGPYSLQQCIHTNEHFDFLKDLVKDVAAPAQPRTD